MSPPAAPATYTVTNRVFLLGLDAMTRAVMKHVEMTQLLPCAQAVASALQVAPANAPIEGYYTEHPSLTAYFKLVRALQEVDENQKSKVEGLAGYKRLCEVMTSPIFGQAVWDDKLLPVGRDPLSMALLKNANQPDRWTVPILTRTAREEALGSDDISLVGLAARNGDEVVLAALRETVVLYAEQASLAAMIEPTPPRYEWKVDQDLADQANRFIEVFNKLTGATLPAAEPENAEAFYKAQEDEKITGRCVRLGHNPLTHPVIYYHWAIRHDENMKLVVHEFWSEKIWTTERYRREGYGLDRPSNRG